MYLNRISSSYESFWSSDDLDDGSGRDSFKDYLEGKAYFTAPDNLNDPMESIPVKAPRDVGLY